MMHLDKYNILVMPTADGCWAWCLTFGMYPTLAYGDVLRDKVSYEDVVFGVLILAWKHSMGLPVQKKFSPLPGVAA